MPAPILRGRAKLDTGYRRSPADIRDIRYGYVAKESITAPEAYALETAKFQLPTYNQGDIPKCTCSASALLKTAQEKVETKKTLLFDDNELYRHVELPGGGAYIRDVLQLLVDQGAQPTTMKNKRKIQMYAGVDPKNHEEVKHAMSTGGLIVVGMEVTRGFCKGGGKEFNPNAEGNENEIVGAHAIAATAYDPDGVTLHNSWGEDWMDGGRTHVTWEFWDKYLFEAWVTVDASDEEIADNIKTRRELNVFNLLGK